MRVLSFHTELLELSELLHGLHYPLFQRRNPESPQTESDSSLASNLDVFVFQLHASNPQETSQGLVVYPTANHLIRPSRSFRILFPVKHPARRTKQCGGGYTNKIKRGQQARTTKILTSDPRTTQ